MGKSGSHINWEWTGGLELGQSSPRELAFVVELGPDIISFTFRMFCYAFTSVYSFFALECLETTSEVRTLYPPHTPLYGTILGYVCCCIIKEICL